MVKKCTSLFVIMLFLSLLGLRAQEITITGKVISAEDQQGLPGVSIQIVGTSQGVITDLDGNYKIKTSKDAVLKFSFVGFIAQEIKVGEEITINVALASDQKSIDEVVVTALGIKREKKALGFSVQDVKGDDLTKASETNIISSLSGKVAGAEIITSSGQVGASSTIKFRGNKGFDKLSSPLFVIDGTPVMNGSNDARSTTTRTDFGNTISDIDPSSIESISVLKGASAAALYGSRGADGVILITTKKGAGAKKGYSVALTSSIAFDNVYNLPNYQNSYGQGYNGDEYTWKTSYPNYETYQAFHDAREFKWATDGTGKRMDYDESWGTRLNVGLLVDQMHGKQQAWVSNPDNIKDFYQTGVTTNNSADISINTEKATGRFSIGQSKQKGTMPNTDQTKFNLGLNSSYKFSKKFKLDVNANFVQLSNDNLPQQGNSMRNPLVEFNSWFGRQVDMNYLKEHYNDIIDYKGNAMAFNWMMDYSGQHNNPYWLAYNNIMERKRNRVYGNIAATYSIMEGVDLMGRVGTDYYSENRKYKFAQYTRDWDSEYKAATNGTFWQQYNISSETNADLILTIKRNLTKDINLFATLGTNYMATLDQYASVSGSNLIVPNFYSTSNIEGQATASFTKYEKKTTSVYGAVNLGYKNFLYLEYTYRCDWFSTLPKESRMFPYSSANIGFVFSELLKLDENILSYGKVRLNYSEVGNGAPLYQLQSTFVPSTPSFNGVNLYSISSVYPTADLKPENTKSYELGAEFKFLNNRVGFDFTYYKSKTYNQLLKVSVSAATGYNSWSKNAGKIENSGIELQTMLVPMKITDFEWTMNINWAKNDNKVLELEGDLKQLQLNSLYYNSYLMAFPGQSWGVIYGTNYKKNDQGQVLINDKGLPITTSSPVELGNVNPDWNGGIRNTFNYKNYSLSILVDMRKGGDVVSMTKAVGQYAGILQNTVDGGIRENGMIVNGVYDAGVKIKNVDVSGQPNTTRISARTYFKASRPWGELAVVDGSFVKLREISLSTTISPEILKKIGIQTLTISAFGKNLALLYKDKSNDVNIDPEVSTGGSISGTGLEAYQLPPSRTFGLKLNLNF
jgi:TonB-linked SusC/RagA family outer membrane protein